MDEDEIVEEVCANCGELFDEDELNEDGYCPDCEEQIEASLAGQSGEEE